MVAHDLKYPLTATLAYGELLQRCADLDGTLHQAVVVPSENGQKMKQILDALLPLASVRKGDVRLRRLDSERLALGALKRLALPAGSEEAVVHVPDSWPTTSGHGPWVEVCGPTI